PARAPRRGRRPRPRANVVPDRARRAPLRATGERRWRAAVCRLRRHARGGCGRRAADVARARHGVRLCSGGAGARRWPRCRGQGRRAVAARGVRAAGARAPR
ncbi:hypothetical protein HK405_014590, partial [Cladochytrium tenue]